MAKRKHLITFLSPGTFTSEQTMRTIPEWNLAAAADMATAIQERHGAKPYAFYFSTDLVGDDVPDGEGGMLKVQPKEVARSPIHHLGGKVLTYEEIEARADPKESTLLSNMRGNDMPLVLQNDNSYRHTVEFKATDLVVDRAGAIVDRGDSPKWTAYRTKLSAQWARR